MHPDLEPLARAFAEKQTRFFEVNRQLDESSRRFMYYDMHALDYHQASGAHTRLWDEWSAALHDLDAAAQVLRERAKELAGPH